MGAPELGSGRNYPAGTQIFLSSGSGRNFFPVTGRNFELVPSQLLSEFDLTLQKQFKSIQEMIFFSFQSLLLVN